MAEVLLARAIGLGGFARHVVIKRIRVEHGSDQKSMNMFLDEARLVASLHHRNIVQVHDVGEEDGKYFFVMEYVHGRDTRELLRHVKDKKEQIPLEHVITIVTAAAAGLHYAHEQLGPDRKPLQIVHRDISPGNILLAFDGGVKVVDFGIAKASARSEDTQAGEMKGKVGYMSPEQCRSQPIDRRTDIFLLGIVLYELCTVRRLFKFDSRFETMAAICDGNVPLPSKFRKDIPQDLERIMLKALAKTPDERYQTADELRLVLEAFASRAGLSISPGRLSDYLKEQFGEVPEPWNVGDAVPPPSAEVLERIRSSSQLIPVQRDSQPVTAKDAKKGDTKSTQPELEAIKAAKPIVDGVPAGPEIVDESSMVYPVAPQTGRRWFRVLLGVLILMAALGVLGFLVLQKMNNQMAAKPMQLDAAPVAIEATADAGIAETTDDAAAKTEASSDPSDAGAGVAATTDDAGVVADLAVDAGAPIAEKTTKPARPKVNKPRPRPRPKQKTDKPEGDKPPDLDSPFPD